MNIRRVQWRHLFIHITLLSDGRLHRPLRCSVWRSTQTGKLYFLDLIAVTPHPAGDPILEDQEAGTIREETQLLDER